MSRLSRTRCPRSYGNAKTQMGLYLMKSVRGCTCRFPERGFEQERDRRRPLRLRAPAQMKLVGNTTTQASSEYIAPAKLLLYTRSESAFFRCQVNWRLFPEWDARPPHTYLSSRAMCALFTPDQPLRPNFFLKQADSSVAASCNISHVQVTTLCYFY